MEARTRGRNPTNGLALRKCQNCGIEFSPYRDIQRACSRKCRNALGPVPESERTNPMEITCQKCGKVSIRYTTIRGGRYNFCADCEKIAARERQDRKNESRRTDPEAKEKNRKIRVKRYYGLTMEQYESMFAAQGERCAICGEFADPNGVRAASRLHVDHDHMTGQVRGLLCNHCNRGLGAFKDKPHLLELAINYLKTYEP